MDMSGVSVGAISGTANSGSRAVDVASVLVQKKAMDMHAENATKIVEAVPEIPASKPSSGPGQVIDVRV